MDISRWLEQNVGARLLMLHDKVYIASDGRIGHTIPGGPSNLILHTVGAKTGQKRDNTLSYARDGDDYLVVASKGGSPKPPAWLANLTADPRCEIQVGRRRIPVTARSTLPDDPDYARRWTIVNSVNADRYTQYQTRTTRPIAVVELRPVSDV